MGYILRQSMHGPAVEYNGQLIFLIEGKRLFEVVDNHPQILYDLTDSVIEFVKTEVAEMISALGEYRLYDPANVFEAINSVHSYNRFVFNEYVAYRSDIALATLGSREMKDIMSLNDPIVNQFYSRVTGAE